jgi:hypothetical protein
MNLELYNTGKELFVVSFYIYAQMLLENSIVNQSLELLTYEPNKN